VTAGACFALVALSGQSETIVMLVDDEVEAREIADEMGRAGQRVDVRRYVPPRDQGTRARTPNRSAG
jgi:hypothetical protein